MVFFFFLGGGGGGMIAMGERREKQVEIGDRRRGRVKWRGGKERERERERERD